jgi:hypothetical protein
MNEWKWKGIIYYLLGLNNSLRHITPFIPKVCCWVELLNETKLKKKILNKLYIYMNYYVYCVGKSYLIIGRGPTKPHYVHSCTYSSQCATWKCETQSHLMWKKRVPICGKEMDNFQ